MKLCIKQFLMSPAIALPRNRHRFENLLDIRHVFVGQRRGLAVLDDALDLGGARDGDGALTTHPTDGHLRRRHALALGNLLHRLDALEVLVEDIGLEARHLAVEIVRRDVVELAPFSRQPAATDRAVCHDGDANCVRIILSVDAIGFF